VLDYAINWADLVPDSDSITGATWTVPTGIAQPSGKPPTRSGDVTTIWLEGGTAGTDYKVSCTITTTQGRIAKRSLTIKVRNR
jgi:hypothetical protein